MYNPAFLGTDLRTLMSTKKTFDKFNKSPEQLEKEQYEKEMAEVGIFGLDTTIEGGMLNNPFMESQVGPAITRAENKYYEQGKFPSEFLGDRIRMNMYTGNEEGKFGPGFADGGIAGLRQNYNEGGPARQNFAMGKRAFLKLLGSGAAGIAGLKTGLFGVGKKEAAKEVVKEVATSSGGVPPYFLKLVSKIKSLGDDVTETSAVADRQKVTRYKDFELTEDVSTGRVEIQRVKVAEDMDYYGSPVTEETFMGYSPAEEIFQQTAKGKTKIIKTQPKYEEGTTYLRNDGPNTGNVLDETSGLSDDIFKEVGEEVPEIIRKTKADGGRIGLFMGGGLTAGKGLAREMLKFMSKGSVNAKTPKELLQLYNPKQFNKLLDNPAYTGKISPKTGETADEMILDIIDQTKNDRSSMIGDLIGSARKIKKVDDDIKKYKQTIIKQMLDGGIDEQTAHSFAEKMAKEMKENAAPQLTSSPPKVTEQGLIELENIQKNLLTKGRQLQATGGLATMLGE